MKAFSNVNPKPYNQGTILPQEDKRIYSKTHGRRKISLRKGKKEYATSIRSFGLRAKSLPTRSALNKTKKGESGAPRARKTAF